MNNTLTLSEINKEAMELLYNELGISKTIKFLNQFSTGKGNYTEQKELLYDGKTVQDIVEQIRRK